MQFKSLRKPIATVLILSTMIPLVIGTSTIIPLVIGTSTRPALASPLKTIIPGEFGLGIGVASLILAEERETGLDRGRFTTRMIERLNREFPEYNAVITFHKESVAEGIEGESFAFPLRSDWGTFYVYMSRIGQPFRFKLNGDGGYENWAYGGEERLNKDRKDADGPVLVIK